MAPMFALHGQARNAHKSDTVSVNWPCNAHVSTLPCSDVPQGPTGTAQDDTPKSRGAPALPGQSDDGTHSSDGNDDSKN